MKGFVTINTDASFCPFNKVGSYAFWITSDLGRIKKFGSLKEVTDPKDCEKKALANALYTLQKSKWNDGTIESIVINSDCKYMFNDIKIDTTDELGSFIVSILNDIVGTNFKLKHVKAHTGNLKMKRSWVNNWCDINAKLSLNKQRR